MTTSDAGRRTGPEYLLLCGAVAAIGAGLVVYARTVAFAWDEGFHLLAAQLIDAGKRPYADFLFAQTPLNAYWNAFWMHVFGETWRVPHTVAALLVLGAVFLTADFVWTRFPVPSWRFAAALVAAISVGLNVAVVQFGTVGQAYGFCLFAIVAAYRMSVMAVQRPGWWAALPAGYFAGAAACGSLLVSTAGPVLFAWIVLRNRNGSTWGKGAAFAAGALAGLAPLLFLLAQAPEQTLFGAFEYHLFNRSVQWSRATSNNIDVLSSWIDSVQSVALILLSAGGFLFLNSRSPFPPERRSELRLCAWLTLAIAIPLCMPRPTFARYFLFVVPFMSILASVGLYAAGSKLSARRLTPVVIYGVLVSLGLARTLYNARDEFRWPDLEPVAKKVAEVTPPGTPLLADEHVCFLARRQPPSGLEYGDSHKLRLSPDRAALLHVIPRDELNREVKAGRFGTVETCSDDLVDDLGVDKLYSQSATIGDCRVFWKFGNTAPAR